MEISIVLSNGLACNMNCSYCCAPCTSNAKIQIDQAALLLSIERNSVYQEAKRNGEKVTFDFWGGEPLMKLEAIKYLYSLLKKNFNPDGFFISTNGKLIKDDIVYQFLTEHTDIKIQLSHDGIGQIYRDPNGVDILQDTVIRDRVVELVHSGQLNLINTTMSQKNPSIMANVFYWQSFIWNNNLQDAHLEIKLNHITDRDGEFAFRPPELQLYIHEIEKAMMGSYLSPDSMMWRPFAGYFNNQSSRYELFTVDNSCGQFTKGARKDNWAINTLGKSVGCQLYDNNEDLPNPKLETPEECNHCEYFKYKDTHPCPNTVYGKNPCIYCKEFIRLVLRMEIFRKTVDSLRGNPQKACACKR